MKRGEQKQMAAPGRRYNRYQYETSPRKIQPKEEPQKLPKKPKKASTSSKKTKQEEIAKSKKIETKMKVKMVVYLVVRFCCPLCYWFQKFSDK